MSVYHSCLIDKYLDQLIKILQDSHVDYIYFEFFFFLYCKEIEHILRGITLSLQSGVSYAIFTPNTSILKLNFGFEKKKKGMHFYVVKDNKLI